MYYVLDVNAGLVPPAADFPTRVMRELKASFMSNLFFYAALFSVKLALIVFFKRLGNNVRGQKYIWWPAFVLSAVCLAVSVGDIGYPCLINSDIQYLSTYCVSPEHSTKMTNTVTANCVLDIVSDIASKSDQPSATPSWFLYHHVLARSFLPTDSETFCSYNHSSHSALECAG